MASPTTPPEVDLPVELPEGVKRLPRPGNYRGTEPITDDDWRQRMLHVVAYRHAGYSTAKICELTGLSTGQIKYAMVRAREVGLKKAELQTRLDDVALPLAVEGLIQILEDPNHEQYYQAVRDTLYGRGEFRNHSHSLNENRNLNLNLTVEYEMPDGAKVPDVVQVTEKTGLMLGRPREDTPDGIDTRRQ